MSENQQNSTEGIITTIQAPEPWQRIIKVEIARSFFDKEYNDRLKQAVKGHTKPGFRKGRIPRAVVEKEVGQVLRMDTIEALVPKAWMAGVIEHKLAPITDPALENLDFGEEGPLKFDLMVEVRPEVLITDFEGIKAKKRSVEIKDEEIDEVLERLRQSKASFETVERAAAEGDQVTLDLLPGDAEGNPSEERRITDQQLILGAENNMPAFNEALAGAKAGEERTIEVVYPDDHPNEGLKGQSMTFHCEIKQIAEKVLPDLDDALATAIEEGKTLAELRDDIRANLTTETERRIVQELDQQIQEELVRRNDVSIPPSMVNRYLESGLEEMHKRNLQIGRANSEEEDKEYLEVGKPHAEKALKAMLLMEALQQKEGIKVSDEDVEERIVELAAENGFEVDRYREFVNSGEEKGRLKYDILERRTYDFLLSRAEIESVSADTDVLAEEKEK